MTIMIMELSSEQVRQEERSGAFHVTLNQTMQEFIFVLEVEDMHRHRPQLILNLP
jgi:hypothetical protein